MAFLYPWFLPLTEGMHGGCWRHPSPVPLGLWHLGLNDPHILPPSEFDEGEESVGFGIKDTKVQFRDLHHVIGRHGHYLFFLILN